MTTIISLMAIGTLLVFLETCVVGGILGLLGTACFGWAIWNSYVLWGAFGALGAVATAVLASTGAFLFWLYVIPKTPFGKKIYLTTSESGKSPAPDFEPLKGKEGVALTQMLPYGKVEIDGKPYDAKSFASLEIKKGEKVTVVNADSFCLYVEKI